MKQTNKQKNLPELPVWSPALEGELSPSSGESREHFYALNTFVFSSLRYPSYVVFTCRKKLRYSSSRNGEP